MRTHRIATVLAVGVIAVSVPLAAQHRRTAAPRAARSAPAPALDALSIQVMLDRVHFSPGEIDGLFGANTQRAIAAFREARGLSGDANNRNAIASAMGAEGVPPLVVYTVTAENVAGPFVETIPRDLMEQSELPALGFRSALESLAEQFHASPALLTRLNPRATFTEGAEIQVPNVGAAQEIVAPGEVTVTVSAGSHTLKATDAAGTIVMFAPVTSGSEYDPLPIGRWKVTGVQQNPSFHYNPDLFWDANPAHSKAKIPPGPNGPVGVVWIGLDREHYGIHGSAEPSTIGKTTSHGCVRLTNWDAMRLASLVTKGTAVVFIE